MARAEHPVAEAAGRFLENFKRPAKLLIAVSGGSDSAGLLVALAALAGRFPHIALCACTIDHDLRLGSAAEAVSGGALCARYGVPHTVRRWEGLKPATGLQAAARERRYALLVDAATAAGADAILAAHTSDDQSETVTMRAARAETGVGLAGMADGVLLNGSVWLLRPFLGVGRAEIRDFLTAEGEGWIDDPSNLNPRFERVRVRNDAVTALPVADERSALARRGAAFLAEHVRAAERHFSLADRGIGAALSDPAAWRGLLLLAATAGGRVHTLEARSAVRLKTFLASGALSRLTAGRVVFDRRRDGLHLYREDRGLQPLVLSAGETGMWDGRFRVSSHSTRPIVIFASSAAAGALNGPALRAARTAPRVEFSGGGAVEAGDVTVVPVIAPYDRFLPRFDLPLADALALLIGLPRFPAPPDKG